MVIFSACKLSINWNRVTRFSLKSSDVHKAKCKNAALYTSKGYAAELLSVRQMLYCFVFFLIKKKTYFCLHKNHQKTFSSTYALFEIPIYNRAPEPSPGAFRARSVVYSPVHQSRLSYSSIQGCGQPTGKASRHSWTCSTRALHP